MFDFDKKFEDRLTLMGVILFSFVITFLIIYQNSTHEILGSSYRDVFFYLIEAFRMSGGHIDGYAYVNYLPPFIPFLTSILFRMGFVLKESIFVISGVFFFIGIVGFFYLLKLRFNNFYSLFGSFLYATLFINLSWVANGTLDIAFVALMMWALYFFIQAMDSNQKYFYIAFPLGVLSFFTKYTGGVIFPVMILYFMVKTNILFNIKKYFKHFLGGIIAGVLTSIPFFAYFFLNNIPLGFLNQAAEVSSESSLTTTHAGQLVGNDLFFYIRGVISYFTSTRYAFAVIIVSIIIIGIAVVLYMFSNSFKNSYLKSENYRSKIYKFSVPLKLMHILLVLGILIIAISFFTASLFSFAYSEILVFFGLFLLGYSLTKIILSVEKVEDISLSTCPYLVINIAMAGFFLLFLIFFTAHLTKADRYFTSMAPGFIFLAVLSVEILLSKIKGIEIRKFNLKYLIPIFMMILMFASAVFYITDINDDSVALDEINASKWMDGKEGIVLSDRAPIFTWYLKQEIKYPSNMENPTLINQELINTNATYYISADKINLTSFKDVKDFDNVHIYARNH